GPRARPARARRGATPARARLPRSARRRLAARAVREARLPGRRPARLLHAAPEPADAPQAAHTPARAAPAERRGAARALPGGGGRDPRPVGDAVRGAVDGRPRRGRLPRLPPRPEPGPAR